MANAGQSPTSAALQIAMDALAMPNWDQDEMICALTDIARLLAAQEALDALSELEPSSGGSNGAT